MDKEFWAIIFEDGPLPLTELCMILQTLYSSEEDWHDALPDEGGNVIHDIGGWLAGKLIQRNLGVSCEHYLLEEDSLWLVDVTDPAAQKPETVTIGGTDVCFPS